MQLANSHANVGFEKTNIETVKKTVPKRNPINPAKLKIIKVLGKIELTYFRQSPIPLSALRIGLLMFAPVPVNYVCTALMMFIVVVFFVDYYGAFTSIAREISYRC